jgi:hypothetical protein
LIGHAMDRSTHQRFRVCRLSQRRERVAASVFQLMARGTASQAETPFVLGERTGGGIFRFAAD